MQVVKLILVLSLFCLFVAAGLETVDQEWQERAPQTSINQEMVLPPVEFTSSAQSNSLLFQLTVICSQWLQAMARTVLEGIVVLLD